MFYIYKDFELQGVLTQYESVQWTRKYNDIGTFETILPFDKEMFSLLEIDNVIYNKETKEGCFILARRINVDAFGNEKIQISGKCISCILENRITSYTGSQTISTTISSLINSNFISATNSRKNILNMELKPINLIKNPIISIKYDNTEVLTILKEICQINEIGFKIDYNVLRKKFVFYVYEGQVKTDVMFSSMFNNVLEQEYYYSTDGNKNTCLVDNDGSITIVNDSNTGLARKETYTTLNTEDTLTATEQGKLFLQGLKTIETMDTIIDTNSIQFEYLRDWDLGDVTTCKNAKWGVTIQKNILEIEEFYDSTGKYLSVVFGDIIPTLKSVISGGGGSGSVQGSSGASGTDGYTPVKGVDYFDGTKGDKGDQGIQGIQGTNGIQGVKGDAGERGLQGAQGIQGEKGDKGNIGLQGLQGIQGIKGDTGSQGEKGDKGDKGEQGTSGINGLTTAVRLGTMQYNQNNGVVNLPSYPTSLSQLIDDIGASGGEQGTLIFDTLAAQQGTKLKEYKVGENYVSDIRLSSNNLLLASKTESRSGTSYITVIKVYEDNGTTVKQTITITEKKTSNGYETTIT